MHTSTTIAPSNVTSDFRAFCPPTRTIERKSAERVLVATFSDDERTIAPSRYAEEIAEFFDSRENRDLRALMGSNRAPFLS